MLSRLESTGSEDRDHHINGLGKSQYLLDSKMARLQVFR